jgi:outer membrane scaffolding protein for murein synthesis (MipA/OmpV family)
MRTLETRRCQFARGMSGLVNYVTVLLVSGAERSISPFRLSAALLTMITSVASAEESADAGGAQSDTADSTAAQTRDVSNRPDAYGGKWRFLLGAGVINAPRYPGSPDDFTRGLPVLSISYDRYFIGAGPGSGAPAGLGAFLLRTDHWAVGVNAGGDTRKPRRASDDSILYGWGDIPGTVRGGMFANYTLGWFSVHGSVSAAGHDEGVLATLGAELKYRPMPS